MEQDKVSLTVDGACEECHHLGWFVSTSGHGEGIERCDVCKVFEHDGIATAHVLALMIDLLEASPLATDDSRVGTLVYALEVLAGDYATIDSREPPKPPQCVRRRAASIYKVEGLVDRAFALGWRVIAIVPNHQTAEATVFLEAPGDADPNEIDKD